MTLLSLGLLGNKSSKGRVLIAVIVTVRTAVSATSAAATLPLDVTALNTGAVEDAIVALIVVLGTASRGQSLVDLVLVVAWNISVSRVYLSVRSNQVIPMFKSVFPQ